MGHEKHIITLRKINSGLLDIALKVGRGDIPEPHSDEAKKMMSNLLRWQSMAVNISKQAHSQISLAEVNMQAQRRKRNAGPFGSRQSNRSRMKNAQTILEACDVATGTCGYILDRLGRNAKLELAKDLAERGAKMIKKAQDGNAHELTHVVQQGGNPPPPTPPNNATSVVGVLLLLASAISLLSIVIKGKK